TGLIGMWKAFRQLHEMHLLEGGAAGGSLPRMISVQAEGCAPIVRAFEAGAERAEPWDEAHTLAPGIRVPHVFADDLVLRTLYESGGRAVAVSDDAIVDAVSRLAREEGLDASPEGAATVAGLELLVELGEVDPEERVVLFNCGTGLKHPELRPNGR
ncbi:MAG: pyridoxal-phosphate dependent enzyme, partial [Holophagales bacterium]|nr:pyridoxal-phosphate dependent enzyme [Holophagales bacterium]